MRIISGKYRGKKLKGFDIDGTRPTMDRIKESLFSMIRGYIPNSTVLDLFAGSGALGLEAISNGAKKCFLVDNNSVSIKPLNFQNENNFIQTMIAANNQKFKRFFTKKPILEDKKTKKNDTWFL